jgi:formate dehydrogenase subunit gamma
MAAYDVQRGDQVHPGKPVTVDRYPVGARINHWITATTLVLLAISGLSLFHPSLYFLSGLFGGGAWVRVIHPWLGVLLFFSFLGLFLRFCKANLWRREDGTWLARVRDVLSAHEENLPEVGKYNAGQKFVFWAMSVLIVILISTGLIIWEQYFSTYTSIP